MERIYNWSLLIIKDTADKRYRYMYITCLMIFKLTVDVFHAARSLFLCPPPACPPPPQPIVSACVTWNFWFGLYSVKKKHNKKVYYMFCSDKGENSKNKNCHVRLSLSKNKHVYFNMQTHYIRFLFKISLIRCMLSSNLIYEQFKDSIW